MTLPLRIVTFFLPLPFLLVTQLTLPYDPQGYVEPMFVLLFSFGVALLFAFKNLCAYVQDKSGVLLSSLVFSGAIYSLGVLSSAMAYDRVNFYSFLVLGLLLIVFTQYVQVTKN
jgi:hypothetical protein